jgi:Polyketide cyclase / dehydrase and lipid transport
VGAIHLEVAIERPTDVVWAYLSDPRHDVDWQLDLLHSTHRPQGPIRVGTRKFKVRRTRFENQLVEVEYTHLDHEAREWQERVTVGILRGSSGHYRVVGYGQGSRVLVDLETQAPGLRRFVMPLVDRSTRSDLAADLAKLKGVLEARKARTVASGT